MRLVCLGTAGYHPTDRRQTSCLMIPEAGLVLDAGTGFYRLRNWLQTAHLDIFLTHAHLDHCVGLTYLFSVLEGRGDVRATVHGAEAKLASIRAHLFHPDLFPVLPPFHWQPLQGPVDLASGARVTFWPQSHPGGSLGYRIDWPDRALAFVTDTQADAAADYRQFLTGVDLLVHECSYPDDQADKASRTGHSCLTPVAELARNAGVGRLLLTHIDPQVDRQTPLRVSIARAIFPATDLAEDGLVVDF